MLLLGDLVLGKTTIIKLIIELYKKNGKKTVLCAPTGRAAKRMTIVTNQEAMTLHRLLEIGKIEEEGKMTNINYDVTPIDADVIIIDEMSMVDLFLMSYVVKAVYLGTKLVLVGDVNQLPSVGPGSILSDIINSKKITTITLNKIFRQAAESKIIINSHRVNRGEYFIKKDESNIFVSSKEIVKKIFIYSLPSIIISIVASLYDTTDQILVIRGASLLGFSTSDAETMGSIISTWGVKICMIVAAIGMAISINTIPHMVSSYINKDYKEVSNKLNQILKTALVIMAPMSIGVSILAKPLYTIFYGESLYGPLILSVVIFASLLANLNNVLNTALIGISEYKIIYINTILGVVLNLLMDIPFMIIFDKLGLFPVWGASFSSILSFSIATLLACTMLKQKYNISFKDFNSALKKVIISCVAFSIPLIILNIFVKWNYNFIVTFLIMVLYMIIGASIYIYINCKNGLIYDIFGKDIFTKIKNKLKLGKEN